MKKLIYFALFIFAVACGSKSQQYSQINNEYLAQYRDTIIGRFNGIDIDTLIAEPINTAKERAMWDWLIYSKKHTVDSLITTQLFNVKMVLEGDLDGNHTDEFGIRREREMGTWDNYYIYSFYNGKWQYLTDPIWTYSTHFYGELNNGNDVTERTDKPNIIKVRFSDVRNNGEDFLIIDTLVQVNPQIIEFAK